MKTKIKKIKPVDSDVHFKYICPNIECLSTHWLSLKESQTKHYKVVCDCGEVFSPKRIKDITVNFIENIKPAKNTQEETRIVFEFLEEAKKTLMNFGFSETEASTMIKDAHRKSKETNSAKLVKQALDFFGGKND